ncbi:MAG: dynamin family protein [Bacillota bacterium]|nr:dynamin family protein [Bacillota bacterium]
MDILDTTINLKQTLDGYELCRMQANQIEGLLQKLRKKEVTIAVIGQFKRGKTTMVNSMLGSKLLPVGIVPITAAVTRIRYGDESSVVYYQNGLSEEVPADQLHSFISEQENPDNARGVAEVELRTKSDFLKDGLVLVDTPGVGSVHENNSRSAYEFARESDGVIFMLSVDSPVNQIEIEFLKSVRKYAGKFYFAVNKIDTIDDEDLQEYLQYCNALICGIMDCEPGSEEAEAIRLIPISAKKDVGIECLCDMIRDDLIHKAGEIMAQSVSLKILEILKNTKTQIRSYREVLKMAPNVFNSRFREIHLYLDGRRAELGGIRTGGGTLLRARLNEEKAVLSAKVRELFGIEYFYYVDRDNAAEVLTADDYADELEATYEELAKTLDAIFMYKEENAYTVARRIEDLNILMHELDKYRREYERIIH